MRLTILLMLLHCSLGNIATFGQNEKTTQNLDFDSTKIIQYTNGYFISSEITNTTSRASCNLSAKLLDDSLGFYTWERLLENGTCCSVLGNVTYHVFGPFQVDQNGLNTFTGQQIGWDGMLFLYSTSFDPDNPTNNFIAGNDDGPGGIGTSEFQAQLVTNTDYFLVTTGYQPGDFGIFHNQITGSGSTLCDPAIIMSCDLSAVTENFIFWNSVWYRPLVSNGTCCSSLGPLSYHVYGPFTVDVNYFYQFLSVQNGWDGVLFLYEDSFDPATPAINLYAYNDDGPGGIGTSEFIVELDVSTEYFLVTTGYNKQDFGAFVNSIQSLGPGTVNCTSLGIGENTIEGFIFYPNPTSGLLHLKAHTQLESVEIYDMQGKKVFNDLIGATQHQVDLAHLASGMYILKITSNGITENYSLLKK